MDRKIRITFFPANASKVRFLSFSRRSGLLLIGLASLLSIFGYWLLFSGALHEPREQSALRARLKADNTALKDRVEGLESDAQEVLKGLRHLEGIKDEALLATGLVNSGSSNGRNALGLWSFFKKHGTSEADPGASLASARAISLFYDSTLVVLRNAKDQSEAFPTGLPVSRSAIMTRRFGMTPDPFTGKKAMHAGIDFSDRAGSPIYASGAGDVEAVTQDPIWGISVRIRHRPGMETLYAHLAKATVKRSQRVIRGEMIGHMGESGQSTGTHLHYEMRLQGERVNPLQFLLPSGPGGV
jgi:murein DD-endopeptidase MepM/ murein hydrolase activator NlpD